VRVYFLIIGVFVALLAFSAVPASAHAHGHGDIAMADAGAGTELPDHEGGPTDHDIGHSPADHSHPIGEDDYHIKASHSSLDVADYHVVHVKLACVARADRLPDVHEPVCGIALSPPVRPPLG
jgi:hypothetical protein